MTLLSAVRVLQIIGALGCVPLGILLPALFHYNAYSQQEPLESGLLTVCDGTPTSTEEKISSPLPTDSSPVGHSKLVNGVDIAIIAFGGAGAALALVVRFYS